MNFSKLLTYESRQYMAKLDTMVTDLLESGDQLHNRVLGLARKLWDAGIYNIKGQENPTLDAVVLNRFIPEVVRRLDPSVRLLPYEVARADESKDSILYVPELSDQKLVSVFDHLLHHHGMIAAKRSSDPEAKEIADIFTRLPEHGNPLTALANRLVPGAYAERHSYEPREVLKGYQITLVGLNGHERVGLYRDTLEAAEAGWDQILAMTDESKKPLNDQGEEISPNERLGWRLIDQDRNITQTLKLRSWETGEVLREIDFQTHLSAEVSGPGL